MLSVCFVNYNAMLGLGLIGQIGWFIPMQSNNYNYYIVFAILNLWLLGTVVLKYLQVKYSQIHRVSPYTIIVYGSCRGGKLAGFVVLFVPRISHVQGGTDAFHWRKA